MTLVDQLAALFTWDRLAGVLEILLRMAVIVVITAIVLRLSGPAVSRVVRDRSTDLDDRRTKTLAGLAESVLRYVIYFFALAALLDQLGVDTRSLIAGAGIAGLAVGFGAQNLVKDVVSGFFILLEDQYAIGDYVTVGGVSGIVEAVGIRTTRVRDFGGQLHILPNGSIDTVTNHMGGAMRVMFPVRIPYEEDVDRVVAILEELFEEVKGELEDIVEGPSVLGINDLGESGVELLIWARAKPMTQFAMTRELRGRVKKRLDEKGIAIPYGRRYIMFQGGPEALGQVFGVSSPAGQGGVPDAPGGSEKAGSTDNSPGERGPAG